jgi:hypothetical protein
MRGIKDELKEVREAIKQASDVCRHGLFACFCPLRCRWGHCMAGGVMQRIKEQEASHKQKQEKVKQKRVSRPCRHATANTHVVPALDSPYRLAWRGRAVDEWAQAFVPNADDVVAKEEAGKQEARLRDEVLPWHQLCRTGLPCGS